MMKTSIPDFIAFDTETATAEPSSICQIGFVIVSDCVIKHRESMLVRPPYNLYNSRNSCLHGIDALQTRYAPSFMVVWSYIWELFTSNLLVAHNSGFDLSVLRRTLRFYRLEVPEFNCDCTYRMTGMSLPDLCDSLEIEMTRHHDALYDAMACAEAFIKLKNGVKPNHQLIRAKTAKNIFSGHEPISGDLLKPDLENADPGHPFYNKRVVFTGVLDRMSRDEAAKLAWANGAIIDHTVSRHTQFVIAGSGAGPVKLQKIGQFNAEGAGIRIITENEFLEMIKT